MVTEFKKDGLTYDAASRRFRRLFEAEREEHIRIYNEYIQRIKEYLYNLPDEELKKIALTVYKPEKVEKFIAKSKKFLYISVMRVAGVKGLLMKDREEAIAVKQYLQYTRNRHLDGTKKRKKITKDRSAGNPALIEYGRNKEKERLKVKAVELGMSFEDLYKIWEVERLQRVEADFLWHFVKYYFMIFSGDFYGSIVFDDPSYLRFSFVDGIPFGKHYQGNKVEYPEYISEDNIKIYYVKNKSTPYNYISSTAHIGNAKFVEYNPEVDELRTCKYNGWTLREILEEMNSTGFIQGTFKPRNPQKYSQNPEELQKTLTSDKNAINEYLNYLKGCEFKGRLGVMPSLTLLDEPIPAPVSKYNKFDKNKITYRSSFELLAFNFLDLCPDIIAWSSETIIVPYIKPQDGQLHKYYVDLWAIVKQPNNKFKIFLIEIKPAKQTKKPRKTAKKSDKTYLTEMLTWATNQAKWAAARIYAQEHGMEFIIWTENELSLASPATKFRGRKK